MTLEVITTQKNHPHLIDYFGKKGAGKKVGYLTKQRLESEGEKVGF